MHILNASQIKKRENHCVGTRMRERIEQGEAGRAVLGGMPDPDGSGDLSQVRGLLLQSLIHIPINKQRLPLAHWNLYSAVLNIDAAGVDTLVAVEGAVKHFGGYAGVAYAAVIAVVHLKRHMLRNAESLEDWVGGPGGQCFTGAR